MKLDPIAQFLFGAAFQKTRLHAGYALFVLILVLGSIPHARQEIGQVASGLVLHSVAYAVITFLICTGSSASRLSNSVRAFCIVAVMGALDECVQSFLPYRHAAISDWMVDCGASFVMALLLYILPIAKPRLPARR